MGRRGDLLLAEVVTVLVLVLPVPTAGEWRTGRSTKATTMENTTMIASE
jgi:hypothetical protein